MDESAPNNLFPNIYTSPPSGQLFLYPSPPRTRLYVCAWVFLCAIGNLCTAPRNSRAQYPGTGGGGREGVQARSQPASFFSDPWLPHQPSHKKEIYRLACVFFGFRRLAPLRVSVMVSDSTGILVFSYFTIHIILYLLRFYSRYCGAPCVPRRMWSPQRLLISWSIAIGSTSSAPSSLASGAIPEAKDRLAKRPPGCLKGWG